MRELKFAIFGAGCPRVETYNTNKLKAQLFDAVCAVEPDSISFTIIDGNDIELYKVLGEVTSLKVSNSAGTERDLESLFISLEKLSFLR